MVLLMLTLDNPVHLDRVLNAWTKAGVPSITILDSTGMQRRREVAAAGKTPPLFLGLARMMSLEKYVHNTLFSVIEDEEIIPQIVRETEKIIGDLSLPHTGMLFTLPVSQAWGVKKGNPPVCEELPSEGGAG